MKKSISPLKTILLLIIGYCVLRFGIKGTATIALIILYEFGIWFVLPAIICLIALIRGVFNLLFGRRRW